MRNISPLPLKKKGQCKIYWDDLKIKMIYKKKKEFFCRFHLITVTKEIFPYLYKPAGFIHVAVGVTILEIVVAERPDSLHKDMNKRAFLKSTPITPV